MTKGQLHHRPTVAHLEKETKAEEALVEQEEIEHLRRTVEPEGATFDLGTSGEVLDPSPLTVPDRDESFGHDDLWWHFRK